MIRLIIAFVVILIVVQQSAFIINEGEQGFVLQFGKLVKVTPDAGFYFKYPVIQDLHRFEKRILVADARPSDYITLDKKKVNVDTVSRWKISKPLVFYRTVRDYRGAIARLDDIIVGRLRQEVANQKFMDLIRAERENIMEQVTKETAEAAKAFGITVVDVRIKRLDLPKEVQASVFARMKAERQRIAKRYRAEGDEKSREIKANAEKEKKIILAEAYRKSEILRGEGDAEATTIYAAAYSKDEEFYSFVRHLEVYEKVFRSKSTLLLRPDSSLLRFLESPISAKDSPRAAGK